MRKFPSFALVSIFLLLALFWPSPRVASGRTSPDDHRSHFRPGALLVKFKSEASRSDRLRALWASQAGEGTTLLGSGTRRVIVPRGQELEKLLQLRSSPAVDYADFDYAVSINWTPNDPQFVSYSQTEQSGQWGLWQIRAPAAWDVTKGEGVTVAVIDTGIDRSHPDLAANLVAGYDFVNGDDSPDDDNDQGHGTHVSGIIAAVGNNAVGGLGVAPAARIMPLKALDSSGRGWNSDIIQAIRYATDRGAQVINMSFGERAADHFLREAVDYAWNKGVLLVAAAGNAGSDAAEYPGAYDNVISVAATDSGDKKASFSNYGSSVRIAAPGVRIYSTARSGYGYRSGTSMAAPLVAGAGALAFAAGRCQNADNAVVRQAIQSAALSIDAANPEYVGQLGSGRLDALGALPSPAVLTAAINRVVLIAQVGDATPQRRTVSVSTGQCATPLSASVVSAGGQEWLITGVTSSPTPAISITASAAGLPAGQYTATVTVRYISPTSPEASVTVDLFVVPQLHGVGLPDVRRLPQ